jgi:hypothetical protein
MKSYLVVIGLPKKGLKADQIGDGTYTVHSAELMASTPERAALRAKVTVAMAADGMLQVDDYKNVIVIGVVELAPTSYSEKQIDDLVRQVVDRYHSDNS